MDLDTAAYDGSWLHILDNFKQQIGGDWREDWEQCHQRRGRTVGGRTRGVLAMAAGCQREGINTSAQKEGLDSKHPAKETNLNEMRPRILLLPSVLEELVSNP